MMRSILVCLVFVLAGNQVSLFGQEFRDAGSEQESCFLHYPSPDYPVLTPGNDRLLRSLPPNVDNAATPFFPEIASQVFATCQQFCSVYYDFAYEMNRLRGLNANLPSSTYPAHYTYNFMSLDGWNGVSFFYSLDVLKKQGCPDVAHYGPDQEQGNLHWMTGYDNYLNAMKNRLSEVYRIPVNTLEGHLTLKNWLFDHLEGDTCGGVAIFSASSPYNYKFIPEGTPEEGKHVIVSWPSPAVHGMTIVGYNDSVRYDINGDGLFTNDVDINSDGLVDLQDWEMGAYKFANSYGTGWADQGYCYVLYSAMARDYNNGGVWDESVYILKPYSEYTPVLTLKATITYDKRENLKISAGVAKGAEASVPEKIIDFPIFNYQGWDHYMQGDDSSDEYKTLELGLDISSLLGFVPPGSAATWFLLVEEQDEDHSGSGVINSFSVLNYAGSVVEHQCTVHNQEILDNSLTTMSVSCPVQFDAVKILTESLPPVTQGQSYSASIQASGGILPYQWSVWQDYTRAGSQTILPESGTQLIEPQSMVIPVTPVKLPFEFRFFGQAYDSVYVNQFGFISFEPLQYPYPYAVEGKLMLSSLKSICAGFNSELENATIHECWYSEKENFVEFLWKLVDEYGVYDVEIKYGIRLFNDGTFEIIFGNLGTVPYFPLAFGYSDGKGRDSGLETIRDLHFMTGKSFHYFSNGFQTEAEIDATGQLILHGLEPGRMYTLNVSVLDKMGVTDHRKFILSDGLVLQETIHLGMDNKISFQEEGLFDISLNNLTSDTLADIMILLQVQDHRIKLLDSIAEIDRLYPGDTISLQNALHVACHEFIPDFTGIPYTISVVCNQGTWLKKGLFQSAAPGIVLSGVLVDDGNNHLLDPGETSDITLYLENQGSVDAEELSVSLLSSDPLLSVLSPGFKQLPVIHAGGAAQVHFTLRANRDATPEQILMMSMFVSNNQGVDIRLPINLIAGRKQVTIINLSRNPNSADTLAKLLDNLGITFKTIDSVPNSSDLAGVPAVFLLLGFYGSYYMLGQEEGIELRNYLESGGNMYMEGYATWRFNTPTPLHAMFSYSTESCSQYRFDTIFAAGNGMFPEMKFNYKGNPPFAIFKVIPEGSAQTLFSNSLQQPKVIQWNNDAGFYRTIGSLVEFGSLVPVIGYPDSEALLLSCLKFFHINTSGMNPLFHSPNRKACIQEPVLFSDDSFNGITTWHWEFPGGKPAFSDEQNPTIVYESAGVFNVSLTVSNGADSCTLSRQNYVNITDCTSVPDDNEETGMKIWPNPASDRISLFFEDLKDTLLYVQISDMSGRRLYDNQCVINEGKILLTLPPFSKGLYMIRGIAGNKRFVSKLVIE